MQSAVNDATLIAMRKQGLDDKGTPISSYWKARIEAEERRVQIQELQATPDKECFWCETECNENYHLDHIVPISKGGRNSLCNIAISCQPCNNKKSDKDLTQWLEEIGWFDSKRSSES